MSSVIARRDRLRNLRAALVRSAPRRPVERIAGRGDPARPVPTDPPEVAALLTSEAFRERVRTVGAKESRDERHALADAAGYLREMAPTHTGFALQAWDRFGRWLMRGYDVFMDEEALARLRRLDRRHALVFLPSHRAYLDVWSAMNLSSRGISRFFVFGGANMDFFPLNVVARRVGVIFIQRSTAGLPLYRLALRSYIAQLVNSGANLSWSIEGGRTRTGKLRPARYGLLNYLVEAVDSFDGPEILLVPQSVVYDQLHEVGAIASEALGAVKRKEGAIWLARYGRSQRKRLGRVYVDFGEPIPLRQTLADLRQEDGGAHEVERIALEVLHRINRVTPATPTAVTCVAMLAAGRALTVDEVLETISPLARYIERRGWPVAGGADLTNRSSVRRTLQELMVSGVLTSYSGDETVWHIVPGKHLVAAFYRNSIIHMLVMRAITELALQAISDSDDPCGSTFVDEALRLRELFKFEFPFARRPDFVEELRAELQLISPDTAPDAESVTVEEARRWLQAAQPHVAHLVLRPFLEAYAVVADRLLALGSDDPHDEQELLDECLKVGRQWVLQGRLLSDESVSLEMFRTALRLARQRGLLEASGPVVRQQRGALAEEIATVAGRTAVIGRMAPVAAPTEGVTTDA
jgi:glycerol-3-phosphate O-acyltransferase